MSSPDETEAAVDAAHYYSSGDAPCADLIRMCEINDYTGLQERLKVTDHAALSQLVCSDYWMLPSHFLSAQMKVSVRVI